MLMWTVPLAHVEKTQTKKIVDLSEQTFKALPGSLSWNYQLLPERFAYVDSAFNLALQECRFGIHEL